MDSTDLVRWLHQLGIPGHIPADEEESKDQIENLGSAQP